MSSEKKYVSMYSIVKEIYEEDNRIDAFNDFNSTVLRKFRDIISGMGINIKSLKIKNDFRIGINQVEAVKELVRSTDIPVSKIKNRKLDDIPRVDVKTLVERLSSIISDTLDEKKYFEEINNMYAVTRLNWYEKYDDFRKEGLNQILSDLESLKSPSHITYINEIDRVALLSYYIQLIKQDSLRFNEVIEIISELRENEVEDISIDMVNEGIDIEDGDEIFFARLLDCSIVIKEADKILDRRLLERTRRKLFQKKKIKYKIKKV